MTGAVRMGLGFWSGEMDAMTGAVRCKIRSSFVMIQYVSVTFLLLVKAWNFPDECETRTFRKIRSLGVDFCFSFFIYRLFVGENLFGGFKRALICN